MYRIVAVLVVIGVYGTTSAGEPAPDVQQAVTKGLEYLTDKGIDWKEDRKCASCHHTPFTLWSLNEAKRSGYPVEDKVLAELTGWVLDPKDPARVFPPKPPEPKTVESPKEVKESVKPAADQPQEKPESEKPEETQAPEQSKETKQPEQPKEPDISVSMSALLMYFGISSGDISAEPTRQTLTRLLTTVVQKQQPDGSWRLSSLAEPINSTPEVISGLTLLALTSPTAAELGDAGKAAREKGLAWLNANPSDSLQGTAIRLMLWRQLDRPESDWQPLVNAIRTKQNADGGWSQIKELPSDAYATGQALLSLLEAGVGADDPAIAKAQAFLVKTQEENGSWPMTSRPKQRDNNSSKNLEPITYAGTAWAVVALSKSKPRTGSPVKSAGE